MRPDTIICEECGKPAPNSRRGSHRRFCPDCNKDRDAKRKKAARDASVPLRQREARNRRSRREAVKKNPSALELEREARRLRQKRLRNKAKLFDQVQAELAKSRIELAKAGDALVEAAQRVNAQFADHEQRLSALEDRTLGNMTFGWKESDDAERVPGGQARADSADDGGRRSSVFDRLR